MKVETISLLKWFSNSSTIITPPERNVKNASINKPSPLTVPDDKMLCNSGIESSSIELTWSLNLSLTLTVLFSSFLRILIPQYLDPNRWLIHVEYYQNR